MSSFINNPKLAPEPLTEIYHVDAHERCNDDRVATVTSDTPWSTSQRAACGLSSTALSPGTKGTST